MVFYFATLDLSSVISMPDENHGRKKSSQSWASPIFALLCQPHATGRMNSTKKKHGAAHVWAEAHKTS